MSVLFRIIFPLGLLLLLISLGLGVLSSFWEGMLPAKLSDKGLIRVMGGCGVGLMATALVFFRGNSTGGETGDQSASKPANGE